MTEAASIPVTRAQFRLRQMIITGDLLPGTRLTEATLAEERELSWSSVQDALCELHEEGLLERDRRGNFVVRSFKLADALDAIEVRGTLEGTAARLAAERAVPLGRMAKLDQIVDLMDESLDPRRDAPDIEAYVRLNGEFHRALASLAGSAVVARELDRVMKLPFASASAFMQSDWKDTAFRASLVTAQAQHRSIVDAIVQREGARAEALAREHARLARQNFEAAVATRRTLNYHGSCIALFKS